VAPFKKGPDYIDAAWLSLAAGRPCYNLDTFLLGREQVVRSFTRRAPAESVALIEGNRGLYDGMNPEGEHSSAELAKLLAAPVVLVVDCDKVTRTAAAMVLGCRQLDPAVDIRGVILNRVGGKRHGDIARQAVERYAGVPVLGIVPRLDAADLPFPERHLGLVPPQEHDRSRAVLEKAGELAEAYLAMEAIIRIAGSAPDWPAEVCRAAAPATEAVAAEPVTIGVIRDRAFQFYYRENIEALEDAGARIVEISAIDGKSLPDLDALYIGGGFPETQAGALSANAAFRRSLREAAEKGLPIYAECGGFIYLGESLTVGAVRYPMAGALPVAFGMERRPQGHGYTRLEADRENPFFPLGTALKGHEFHYCRILSGGAEGARTAFRVRRGTGIDGKREGMVRRNILAGFTHLHALGTPEWAPALVEKARQHRAEKDRRPL
jgi:cobyrinic acid a,c-diamide synthase